MTEAQLTKQIVESFKKMRTAGKPIWWFKIHGGPMQRAGVPDLAVILDGRTVWLEIKTPCGTVSKRQEHEAGLMREAGAAVYVVRSLEDAHAALDARGLTRCPS